MSTDNPFVISMRQHVGAASAFLREHPGTAVSLAYATVSLIGIMFSWSLYFHFGIAYFLCVPTLRIRRA